MAHGKARKYQNTPESMQEANFNVINRLLGLWDGLEDKTSKGKGRVFSYGSILSRMIVDYQRTNPDVQKLHEVLAKYEELNREFELAKKAGILNQRNSSIEQATPTQNNT